jgi:hypothetical protein
MSNTQELARTIASTMTASYNQRRMDDYKQQDWVALYQSALIELERAKIAGRINAAQKAIIARVETLRALPGLHTEERHAIDDALRALTFLQREEARFDAEAERRAVDESLQHLRAIGPTIERLKNTPDPD